MERVIIFGTGWLSQLAHYYFTHDSDLTVVAYTVDREFLSDERVLGLPVVPFDRLEREYAPPEHAVFIGVGYQQLNRVRRDKFIEARRRGYSSVNYISSAATVWKADALGENCLVMEGAVVQAFASVGNNVFLNTSVKVGHHSYVGDHTFVGAHAVIAGGVQIGEQCFIGVNATIRDGVKIGPRCVIGAGALIMSDADADGVYRAEPTRRSDSPSSRLRRI